MIEICSDFNLTQHVNFSTRLNNTLDLFLTTEPATVANIRPLPPISDHDLIVTDLKLNVKTKPKSQRVIYLWNKANMENLTKEVSDKLQNYTWDEDDIDNNWNFLRNTLLEAQEKHVPHKLTSTRHNLPWYNKKLRRLSNKKHRLYKKAKKSNLQADMSSFKTCRAEYKKCLREAQRDYFLDFLEPKLDTNGKYLFNHIKRLKRDVVGIEALQLNGNMTTDPKEKAEALAQQYESVFVNENVSNIPHILPSPYPDMHEFTITESGVLKQLN